MIHAPTGHRCHSPSTAAATAVDKALDSGHFSKIAMDTYVSPLESSFVGAGMAIYSRAPAFLEDPEVHKGVGLLLAAVFHGVYDHDLMPRQHLLKVAWGALSKSKLSMSRLARIAWQVIRAL